jgi:hypothetical protein
MPIKTKEEKPDSQKLYTKWRDIMRAAAKFRDNIISSEDFKVYSNYYKGRFNREKKKTDRVEVNKVFSVTGLMTSALVYTDPWIALKSKVDEFKSREHIAEEALNNTLTEIEFSDTLEDNIRDAQLYGYGVGKCGYAFETNIKDLKEEKKGKKNQVEKPVYNLHIKKESVYFHLIDPKRILLDPTCLQSIKDSKFLIEILIQPKKYLEENYQIDLSKMSAGVPEFLKVAFDDLADESKKVFDMCVFYEIWDIIKRQRLIMIEGYTEKVFEFEWPDYLIDDDTGDVEYPHEMLIFNKSPNEPYGISDVSLYRTQQEELNTLRSTEAEAVKKNNPRWQAVSEGAELKEIKKFLNNETGTVVGVKQPNAISPIQPHEMSMDYDRYERQITGDIGDTMGVTDAMGGAQKSKTKTATEAYSKDFFARLRIGKRQSKVDKYTIRVSEKLHRIMSKKYDTSHFVRLAEKGQFLSKKYVGKDISGKFEYSLQQGTGAQNKAYMAQLVGKGLDLLNGNPLVNPLEWAEIARDVYFDGVDTSKLILPNMEQIFKDPIYAEMWRQFMLVVNQGQMIKQATTQSQQPQGNPQIGGGQAMPGTEEPGAPAVPQMAQQPKLGM